VPNCKVFLARSLLLSELRMQAGVCACVLCVVVVCVCVCLSVCVCVCVFGTHARITLIKPQKIMHLRAFYSF
jgi:hypothetical protein